MAGQVDALYIYLLVPEFLMRFIVWMLIHSVYRLKKSGLERIPAPGNTLPPRRRSTSRDRS